MSFSRNKSPKKEVSPVEELRILLLNYLKQETLDPLKDIFKWTAFGVVGTFLAGIGLVFLTLGGLRVLQNQTGDLFDGSFQWVPYFLTILALLLLVLVIVKFLIKRKTRQDK